MVKDTTTKYKSNSDVPVACEILDVFLDEFPSLPTHREIEFCINVVPDTAHISMAPYRMAPAELKESKDQLKESKGIQTIFVSVCNSIHWWHIGVFEEHGRTCVSFEDNIADTKGTSALC